jgi:hopene-associated glycosyltransferase HpnB
MLTLATLTGASAAVIWAFLLLGRGDFWRVRRWTAPVPRDGSRTPDPLCAKAAHSGSLRVAAVVPARNEAEFIAASVTSLLNQGVDVFLVDDHSTDATSSIARTAAAEAGKSASLNVIMAETLPAGWSGKLWALEQGVASALKTSPDFLLLTDADIVHGPQTLATLTALADGYDLVSLMVKLHCQSLAEKLLIPAFVFFFFLLYPPAWIRDARRGSAGAAGGCILIRPRALERAGGLEAIRGEIIDDCALARAVKRSGGRVSLWLTTGSASVRPYESWAGIGRMISRTAFNQLRHSAWLLSATVFALLVVYLSPPLLLLARHTAPVVLGALAWGLMAVAYFPILRFYGLHPGWALTLPLAAAFYASATLDSAIRYWRGRGGEWKGRVQDAPTADHQYSPKS